MRLSFFENLTLLFVGLKLTNNIDWNWLFVLLPLVVEAVMCMVISAHAQDGDEDD